MSDYCLGVQLCLDWEMATRAQTRLLGLDSE